MAKNQPMVPPAPRLDLLRRLLGLEPKPLTNDEWWRWYSHYLKSDDWKRQASNEQVMIPNKIAQRREK
jgi:hypothetical protein